MTDGPKGARYGSRDPFCMRNSGLVACTYDDGRYTLRLKNSIASICCGFVAKLLYDMRQQIEPVEFEPHLARVC